MKKLLSLPQNLVGCFHDVTGLDSKEWYCNNDPADKKLGSGGGTTWLVEHCYNDTNNGESFDEWLSKEKRIILHAGGQSRRLPSYAPSGKILTPIPVFRWERGQKLDQSLLELQLPLYEKIMSKAPDNISTMIVSGDVYIRSTKPLGKIPNADVICYGLWLDAGIAKNHGVFVSSREEPTKLQCMLQKPSLETLSKVLERGYYLTDIGIWMLSEKALKVLMKKSRKNGEMINYDMYSEFGCALGSNPTIEDEEIRQLSVAVLPLPGGEFYHYGTTREIISSTLAIQNIVNDQREIMHNSRKPHPAMFIQNSDVKVKVNERNQQLWIENSYIGKQWTLGHSNVITGVPENDWEIYIKDTQCLDFVPYADTLYALRPYGFNDAFRGKLTDESTLYLGMPFAQWATIHNIDINTIEGANDLQSSKIFPLLEDREEMGLVAKWMLGNEANDEALNIWNKAEKVCADEISLNANLRRLNLQRSKLRAENINALANNYQYSVFYQIDLGNAAQAIVNAQRPSPTPIDDNNPLMLRIHDNMFHSEVKRLQGIDGTEEANKAFSLLKDGLTQPLLKDKQHPRMSVFGDQIVWGRSPVRIDIAGGWTDTPPYCLLEGGDVINFAIELNGQPPLQTYVKPSAEPIIILRSIDLGSEERITTYEQLADFKKVGSPFSIPKAALALAGFLPDFCEEKYSTLRQQLEAFGCGIEVTMLSAIPAGSGLGTSSILASTVLGALNDFCGLAWDKATIGIRTLVLEQLLTTGGGWQDQFGGLLSGVKLLHTERGFNQTPSVRWLPTELFTNQDYSPCHLLYYTGITRTAKTLLAEIVRKMFLNNHDEIAILRQMKEHTMNLYDIIQCGDFEGYGTAIRETWSQNQAMDAGTNPAAVRALTEMIDDLCLGYKLPGAGGGGYLYMVAKDLDAAVRIRQILSQNPPNKLARFVDMSLSNKGLQISRS